MNDRARQGATEGRPHLAVEEVVAYVHGALPADRREPVEVHLADCDRCRSEVTDAIRDGEFSSSPATPWWKPALLVAGLAGLIVVGAVARGSGPAEEPVFRDGPASLQEEGVARIQVVAPRDGAPVSRDSLRFVWRAPEGGAFYRFSLVDAAGDVLLRRDVADTTLFVGPDVPLAAGQEYFWYVDILLASGVSATTDVHRFGVKGGSEAEGPR